jgi:hypothetical protein
MNTITDIATLVVEYCYLCGTPFAMEKQLQRHFLDNGDAFYCPNGHGQIYKDTREQEIKKLRQQLNNTEADVQWWRQEAEQKAKSLSATRGVLTKTKNRIANGVCPCCHRQFVDLHQHMENKHPDYVKKDNLLV